MPEPLAARRTDARPPLADYLTDAEMDRLAGVLVRLLISAARNERRADGGEHAPPSKNGARPG